ncbi:unnamed protein product [Parascedosporium putredinis]|uniref:Uncharacterized protein n=1 Tax=Parascedosporium putredinis TaxID=1442378 RepID=A0A9P1H9H9_9PEZI|nr:unnamed protein product [Parascedosporium putredinis]CAI8000984.1 unnamed protein product [Parascedosporium putredinis]
MTSSLIETGSTRLIRETAVNQLADWQKQHPDELLTYCRAIGKIIEHAPVYDPNEDDGDSGSFLDKKEEVPDSNGQVKKEEGDGDLPLGTGDYLQLESLPVVSIVKNGRELLRGGQIDFGLAALEPQERLAYLKQTLPARLGLLGRRVEDDELPPIPVNGNAQTPGGDGANHATLGRGDSMAGNSQSQGGEEAGLSSRQLNVLKRKRKREAQKAAQGKSGFGDLSIRRSGTAGSEGFGDETPTADPESKKNGKLNDYFSLERPADVDEDTKVVSEFKGPSVEIKTELQVDAALEGAEWPYERLSEFLKMDLFDPKWETRHGAALALREVVRVHGGGAGRCRGKSRNENDKLNKVWLDDLACRLCAVLMLDRFTDYSSDTSVAPIRESIGQTLGAALRHLPPTSVYGIYHLLYQMVMQEGTPLNDLLGQKDLLLEDAKLVDGVCNAVMKGLGDVDDDVRSVSAATLIPMAKEVVTLRPHSLDALINIVWESLSNLGDDLSASTGKIMDLLATLCSFPEVLRTMKQSAAMDEERSFTLLVPRLYPFLRHTITSVRLAVLKALMTFANLGEDASQGWLNGRILRLIFQNIVVERDKETLNTSIELWLTLVKCLSHNPTHLAEEFGAHAEAMLELALHPIDPQQRATKRRRKSTKVEEAPVPSNTHDVDGHMIQGEVDLVGIEVLIRSRVSASRAMGFLMAKLPVQVFPQYAALVLHGLSSPYSSTQMTASVLIEEFAKAVSSPQLAESFIGPLQEMIEAERPSHYRDLTSYVQRARSQCQSLFHLFRDHGKVSASKLPILPVVVQGEPEAGPGAFSIATAEKCVTEDFERLKKAVPPGQKLIAGKQLEEARDLTLQTITEAKLAKGVRDVRIRAAAAASLVAMQVFPKKLSTLIKAIMDSVKTEENLELQNRSSATIAGLIRVFTDKGRRGPAEKVLSNLVKFSCVEVAETPEFSPHAAKTNVILSMQKEEDRVDHVDAAKFAREARAARITRRGAKEALEVLARSYGANLLTQVPSLKGFMENSLVKGFSGALPEEVHDPESIFGQDVIDSLSVIRTLAPTLDSAIHPFLMQMVPYVIKALHSELSVFRYMAAKCMATLCSVLTVECMTVLVEKVLPSISNPVDLHFRQGAIEVVYHLIAVMGDAILPYVIFLIVPVLGRMSDSDNDIRLIATTSFATLVKLVPLEAGIPDPPGLSQELLQGRERERTFIGQLLDPKKIESFKIPVAIKAELRSYQQEGVNWLHFLNKYHLHGILCDDMGLGKTLQTLCIVASDHHQRAEEFAKTGASDQEIKAYAPFLTVAAYVGPPSERKLVKEKLDQPDIVITSYDVCRNDIELLEKYNWNYVVLDEGHLIKNSKAKTSMAVKRLASNHRLILTGTPIQNNVVELWSLFDFLMPGFLGAEKVFQDRFAKPIANSRFSKASSKEQEAGALAIEALHKQVLPFLLRRLKEEVLNDLPPKILQNYYCDLSDLQKKLFEDFSKKQGKKLQAEAGKDDKDAKQHIFQALQYMRKLCNSPALVMRPEHAQYADTQRLLAKQGTSLEDPVHAPKLTALKDLLVDCGIGVEGDNNDPLYQPIKPHRALIFCQMKEMLDMVQNTVLKRMLPSVSFLRMDGSVEANKRQDIVNKFNSDPSYDVLLLTTSVGGLGLNLTGADTVIFVEHDWNPQKDLQAMDRAHRIGQKKVVNVYRLITRGTLEEKILSLQRFKIDVASTVVNQQNAGLSTMDTDQILDLFNIGDDGGLMSDKPQGAASIEGREEDVIDVETGEVRVTGKKGWLDGLGELWDNQQYEESFDLDGFLKTMQ